ncbi:MAG: putative lipid II flippase FtsW [bacterium]
MKILKQKQSAVDKKFLLGIILLVAVGLLVLSSASVILAYQRFGDANYFLKQQLLNGVLVGGILCYLLSRLDYHYWKKWAGVALGVAIVLLLLVFIPGVGVSLKGAHRWIDIFGVSFQVSEVVKLAVIIYLAAWLDNRQERLHSWQTGVLPFLIAMAVVAGLVIIQPDIGTLAVIVAIFLSMYFVAGGSLVALFSMIGAGLALLYMLIKLEPYRLARFTVFLNPETDPLGIGYHIQQALIAIGTGGLWGVGLGHSRQKFLYLPEVTGDSIFAVIAEELGLVVTVLFLLVFLYVIYRGFKIASQAPDLFGKFLVSGIMIWISFQTIINIMAMVGLAPLTGIPLPFISAGGTALAMLLAAVGVVLNVSRQSEKEKR